MCHRILQRSILIKEIIDVFAEATLPAHNQSQNEEQIGKKRLHSEQQKESSPSASTAMVFDYQPLIDSVNESKLQGMLSPSKKFKFSIEGIGRKISMKEQLEIIEMFKKFPFRDEDVSLNNPERVFKVIENRETM